MAVFVDLDEEDVEPPQSPGQHAWHGIGLTFGRKHPRPRATSVNNPDGAQDDADNNGVEGSRTADVQPQEAREADAAGQLKKKDLNGPIAEAMRCYPIVKAIAACIDLNTLDSLSRTCRGVRDGLLDNRDPLVKSTLHCVYEDDPVDPDDTLRYRARASNLFHMEEMGRPLHSHKSGQCARDQVSECRRCGTAVCRNCAIKPPTSVVLRDRHRRLCLACTKSPLGCLAKPSLGPDVSLNSDFLQQAICRCESDGVWLCQPCGRTIRSDDIGYKEEWLWRSRYGDQLLGTGIGDGDRGVSCFRRGECCAAHKYEQETDCDADDAREAEDTHRRSAASSSRSSSSSSITAGYSSHASSSSNSANLGSFPWSGPGSAGSHTSLASTLSGESRRTPSPALGPGYARHEIEGIGGRVKLLRQRLVLIGACVPEWEDEKASGDILSREIRGQLRSWCGWCWRVVPGKQDLERAKAEKSCLVVPVRDGKGKD